MDEARQSRAFEELKDPHSKVSEIAWICGFSDPNYLPDGFVKNRTNSQSMESSRNLNT